MGGAVKVYGVVASPFVATVLLYLEETGVGYELVPVDMAAREQKTKPYLCRNPFGKIPTFEDGEITLFESRAISRYILRKYGPAGTPKDLLRESNLEESAMVDAWMEVEAHQYHPAISNIVRQCVIMPLIGGARDQAVVDENVGKLGKILDVYEARLSSSPYLGGDFFSSSASLISRTLPSPTASWPALNTRRCWRSAPASGHGGEGAWPGRQYLLPFPEETFDDSSLVAKNNNASGSLWATSTKNTDASSFTLKKVDPSSTTSTKNVDAEPSLLAIKTVVSSHSPSAPLAGHHPYIARRLDSHSLLCTVPSLRIEVRVPFPFLGKCLNNVISWNFECTMSE
ncbi:hypothetical protein QYE76_009405 [Lolium multiflorum]|uniref:glutathione transferase n=1 Tax=Lolium multiflorum TaxID=4521 RepID=A0AAD8TUY8_LOLMU|nr:hypothetical protein QYE76_009405 [Lolium multiflorum]